ncbi:MAG: hypothetical protein QUS09_09095 [Methanotrichaceae archaeon]|nr:hypothetical protein [Methanotrichaceae archaeon]
MGANNHKELPEELNATLQNIVCMGSKRDGSPCRRVLGLQAIVEGTIVLKCRRCGMTNILDIQGLEVVDSKTVDEGLGQLGSRAKNT